MTEPSDYADTLEHATRVLWAFNLASADHPEGDGQDYCCPAERYIGNLAEARRLLDDAVVQAFEELPTAIKSQVRVTGKYTPSAADALAEQAPEVRRLWAVKAARDLVANLYEALRDEARPQPRVTLPKLVKNRSR